MRGGHNTYLGQNQPPAQWSGDQMMNAMKAREKQAKEQQISRALGQLSAKQLDEVQALVNSMRNEGGSGA